jgi:cytochrome b561
MQLTNSAARYGAIAQTLHWLTAIAVIVAWPLEQFRWAFPKGPPRDLALWTHMTLGQFVIVFLVARLVLRFVNPPPPPEPTTFGRLQEIASRISHYALYLLLIVVPCVGIVVQLKGGHPLPVLGAFDFASPWPADRATVRNVLFVHQWLANALLFLAGIHAIAALIHHYALRDRTLVRMLPGAT